MKLIRVSASSAVAQTVVAALLGLVALPLVLAEDPGAPTTQLTSAIWLLAGVAVSVWLLAMVPSLASALGQRFAGSDGGVGASPRATPAGAEVAARWLVAVGEVIVIHAILRRPVAEIFGTTATRATVDAAFAAGTLVLLLIILIWLHHTARPLIEAATWQVLDTFVPTSGSERARSLAAAADTALATAPAQTAGAATIAAGATRRVVTDAPTVARVEVDEATVAREAGATIAAPDFTRPAPRPERDPANLPGEPPVTPPSLDDRTIIDDRTRPADPPNA